MSKSETTPHASSSHSRATAATGRGTSTGAAAAESPAELGARPQRTRTAGLRNVANCTWSVFQPKEICCTRSLVTPRKNGKVKLPLLQYWILLLSCVGVAIDSLSLSKIVAVYELIGKHFRNSNDWKETKEILLIHDVRPQQLKLSKL